jgi:hypothetical protein
LLPAGVSNAINTNFFSDLSFHFLKDIAPFGCRRLTTGDRDQSASASEERRGADRAREGGKLTLASYGTGTIQVAHLHEPLHRFDRGRC